MPAGPNSTRLRTVSVFLWWLERVLEEKGQLNTRTKRRGSSKQQELQDWVPAMPQIAENCGIGIVTRSHAVRCRQENEKPGMVLAPLQAHAFVPGLKDEPGAQLHLPGVG